MKKSVRCLLWGIFFLLFHYQSFAQSKTITGTVTSAEDNFKLPGVSIAVKGQARGTTTDATGNYSISAAPTDVLVFSFIGMKTAERKVGEATTINVAMQANTQALSEVVVTALGIKEEKKTLGYAVTEIKGASVAETQRENFANALAGRVAGVEVSSSSGLPGSSVSVMIRGVSSLSGSNQPLYVIDGLPISNNTFNTGNFAGGNALDNRGVDYGNRGADINPEDIETITVLKGPEASALYGIDAASGAIVITTKRGKAGQMQINYSNSFRTDRIVKYPVVQRIYGRGVEGVSDEGNAITTYFGEPYTSEDVLYDNVKNFFQTSNSQKHNLAVSGGNDNSTYRIAASYTDAGSFIPNAGQQKFNLTTALTAKLNKYISTDISVAYAKSDVQSVFNISGGPMLGLLAWPANDDASAYLDDNGSRRRFSTSTTELENPFFNVNMNSINSANDRYITNAKVMVEPTSWFRFVGNVGYDYYTNKITQVRHPESRLSGSTGGIFDQSLDNDRNINIQYYAQLTHSFLNDKLTTDFKVGSAINDQNNYVQSVQGTKFLAPGLYSIENTDPTTNRGRNRLTQRRLVGAFSSLNIGYNGMLYLSLTGRNDWSSTLPKDNNSFFYPSAGLSFIFTELEPLQGIKDVLSYGKLRGSIAQVGKDAAPYMLRPWLEPRNTTGGGFGYAFNGPSESLVPEMTTSYEVGAELKFFNDRLGLDMAYFKKVSRDQIVRNMRLSYGTGYVLKTFNAGEIETGGFEVQLNATPVAGQDFTWNVLANYSHNYSELVKLPTSVPEYYNSDTWLYNNVRNGARVGGPVNSFTGFDYQRNDKGEILINPSTGYPLRDLSEWKVIGDRTPDFMMGLTNSFAYKSLSLSFLFELRKGGDVFNATEHFLTVRGLSTRTLDRFQSRIYDGVLKDGLENSDNPSRNNIVINPAWDSNFYTATSGEIDYIEKDVNWLRLRDVTLRYNLPSSLLQRTRVAKTASVFVTGTDLFLVTNYSGLDPVGSATSLATGGSGGFGFDYGNLPMPMGLNFGINVGF
ncbi:SusC/RagA family TonB-linked outer membrane protein [Pontibacter cellulosilyticus]|uniref:SusC/RagA family TonB-linked outer membrane protein n=1 Tax=Pontibacter cellulosilyticus TaxID=1720253 RepID=A0A923N9W4_9BACT|nr:SusC/RagA family TonB-linked outer membrane protein [Pontibacter cellulosilyticus]MBC5994482.1 SusC/RagA family TonB-linked outer membrane protein [Pontibacter cellulosilyticus]